MHSKQAEYKTDTVQMARGIRSATDHLRGDVGIQSMHAQTIMELALLLVVLMFLWNVKSNIADLRQSVTADLAELRQDIGGLRERVARVEGAFNTLSVKSAQADTPTDSDLL